MDSPLLRLSELSDIDLDRLERLLVISSTSNSPTLITTAPIPPLQSNNMDSDSICEGRQGTVDEESRLDTRYNSRTDTREHEHIDADTPNCYGNELTSTTNRAAYTFSDMELHAASPNVSNANDISTSRYEDRLSCEQAHRYIKGLRLLYQQWEASIQETTIELSCKMTPQESMKIATRRAGGHVLKAAKHLQQHLSDSHQQDDSPIKGAYLSAIKQIWDTHGEHGDLKYLWQHVYEWEQGKNDRETIDPFRAHLIVQRRSGSVEENQQSLIIEAIHDQKPTRLGAYMPRITPEAVIDRPLDILKVQEGQSVGHNATHAPGFERGVAAAVQLPERSVMISSLEGDNRGNANETSSLGSPTMLSALSTRSNASDALNTQDLAQPLQGKRGASTSPNLMNEARLVSKPASPSRQRLQDPAEKEISMKKSLSGRPTRQPDLDSARQIPLQARRPAIDYTSRIPQLVKQSEVIAFPHHSCLQADEQGLRIRGHANAVKAVLEGSDTDPKAGTMSTVSAVSELAPMTPIKSSPLGAESAGDPQKTSTSLLSHVWDKRQSNEMAAPAPRNRKSQLLKPRCGKRDRVPSLKVNCKVARDQSPPKRARIVT